MQWLRSFFDHLGSAIEKCHGKLSELLKKKWSIDYQLTHQSLLDTQDLLTIHASAAADINPLTSKHEVATLLVGERSSSYAGSGYEFAENQLYVSGDDSRFINWRMLAKTGKMYRKKFVEERRPQLWVVIDKRASMRFGTQKRLKVAHAAIQALFHLYQGQQHQLACAGVILDETIRWYKPAQDTNGVQPLIDDIIAPAPPLLNTSASGNDSFNFVVRQLMQRATAGSIIILLSDFQQLTSESLNSLYALTRKHQVIGKHIIDVAETKLPEKGLYQVAAQQSYSKTWLLDCNNNNFRQQYQDAATKHHAKIKQQLSQSGVDYQAYQVDGNVFKGASSEQ